MQEIPLEIERRWLLSSIPVEPAYQVLSIQQIYTDTTRYRLTMDTLTLETKCHSNVKTKVAKGIQTEDEREVSVEEYYQRLREATRGLHKMRHVYKHKDLKFEVDYIPHAGMIILEVELDDINQEIEFPSYLKDKLVREITGEPGLSNRDLALTIK
jgi:CYTH domain-containing protein